MSIVGFSFSKFECEKGRAPVPKDIEIAHNVQLTNVEKTVLQSVSSNDLLRLEFSFEVVYKNDIGKIALKGEVIFNDTKEIIEETKKSWDKDKKISPLVYEQVFKFFHRKACIKAMDLADSLSLPEPIPLPKVSFGSKSKK
ncbi:hypothetical protein H6501_00610 [Candidatus Woesearchaeota archaeon]|nr:hypothetical protein [Nanoarchaeota archaeon]MCB9370081.1 hypothetical protein [Candidatus Woesearchaeota archaeon]USN44612.1 MAG: hypothetical protein H6500_02085 [Candidatus Woesearchaeota archaeon]